MHQLRGTPDVQRARQDLDQERRHSFKQWWKTDAASSPERLRTIEHHRKMHDQVLRLDQNAWLEKHAKQRRCEFSFEQKRMLRQWFNALDSDGSGKISVEELEDPMLSIGIVSDPHEIRQIVGKLDKDANGLIDFQEFVEFLTPHAKKYGKEQIEKHENMFMELTKKMQHQSSGFLEINTQLSMERRRFILDAICSPKTLPMDIPTVDETPSEASSPPPPLQDAARYKSLARKKKLEALQSRHQIEMRLSALEKVFERNGQLQSEPPLLRPVGLLHRLTPKTMPSQDSCVG